MKKVLLLLLLMVNVISIGYTQDIGFDWVEAMGGSSSDDVGKSIDTDENGNVYTTGTFKGTVDFDPSPSNVQNLTAVGLKDIYIQKLDSSGQLLWVKQVGGINDDESSSLKVDANGNVYIIGFFRDTVDFDPDIAIQQNLASVGGTDIFIQKLDSNGNLVWVKQMGGTSFNRGLSIALDLSGNLYATGYFIGTVDFDPNPTTQNLVTSLGSQDFFIQKLDVNGNLVWVKQIGGSNSDVANAIATDKDGNVYTTGYFRGTADFDPSGSVFNLTSVSSDPDIFVHKLDSNGNFVWAKGMGGNGDEKGNAITVDQHGAIYTTGYFRRTVDFDPGTGSFLLTAPTIQQANIFIQKLDNNGSFVWAKQMGNNGEDIAFSITTDKDNHIYATGHFEQTVDFDPGVDTFNLTSNGVEDIFIQKLDSSGNFIWARNIGGASSDYGNSITVDMCKNVYTTGFYKLTVDFDFDTIGVQTQVSSGSEDIYVLKLKAINNFLTGVDVQTACDSYTWIDGNVYTASNNTATDTLRNSAGCDSIVTLNLTINNASTGTDAQTACDSYTWIDGNVYTASNNTATHTLTNVVGCDSVVTLNLTINNASTGTDAQTACDSYTWIDGNVYTVSNNTATHTLTNAVGCDSVVTLNLTINNASTGTDAQTACDSYTWIDGNVYTASNNTATHTLTNAVGCDSVVTLNLTINNASTGTDAQTACDSYTWIDGNVYTASNNTATHTLTNAAGCDSVVTLNLILNTVDTTISQNGLTLTANQNGGTYQWIDCNNGNASITGETAQSFTPVVNGDYAVIITANNCTDTSTCFNLIVNSIPVAIDKSEVRIYPNPTLGQVVIDFEQIVEKGTARLVDVHGRLLLEKSLNDSKSIELNISRLPTAVYFLELQTSKGSYNSKIIKE